MSAWPYGESGLRGIDGRLCSFLSGDGRIELLARDLIAFDELLEANKIFRCAIVVRLRFRETRSRGIHLLLRGR